MRDFRSAAGWLRGGLGAGLRPTGIPQAAALVILALRLGISRLRGGAARRRRDATAVAGTLGRLKGPFAKIGQMVSLRVDLVSPELRDALAGLRDRVPPLPYPVIRGVVERELGRPLEDAFAHFEPESLAAASIAQVHRARLADGTDVAVKVQYPWLEASLPADLMVLRLVQSLAGFGLEHERLFDEFARGIRTELDFEREAQAAREIADNLAGDERIVVPDVIESHSSRRVLTMTWHPTIPINDVQTLESHGVVVVEVLEIVARAYARQIFVDGLFHADPHPGNLFVVDAPDAAHAPRVLFVDFGLCERLSPELTRELRLGIYALLQGDLEDFLAGMQRMGMIAPGAEAAVRAAVERMFERIRGGGQALALSGDRVLGLKDQAVELLYETPGLTLPADLLLYAKTLSYLFSLGAEIAPNVDLMKLSVPYLLRFLAAKDD